MWDSKVSLPTVEISFKQKIVGMKMNTQMIYAATKDKIYMYHLEGMRFMAKLDTENHLGRIVLSPSKINPFLLYSQTINGGDLTVVDYEQKEILNVINCHRKPILKMAINFAGNLVATCSTEG